MLGSAESAKKLALMISADASALQAEMQRAGAVIDAFNARVQAMGAQGEQAESRLSAAFARIRSAVDTLASSLAILGAGFFKMAGTAAKAMSIMDSFNRQMAVIGKDGPNMMNRLRDASNGMVSEMELAQKTTMAFMLIGREAFESVGDAGETMSKLLQISMAASRATGENVNYMFDSIVRGIGRAQPRILDNLGIMIKKGEVYDNFAASLGKTAKQLTLQEQTTAILNEVLRKGNVFIETYGITTGGARTQMQQLGVAMENLRIELGTAFMPVFSKLLEMATALIQPVKALVPALTAVFDLVARIPGPILAAVSAFIALSGALASVQLLMMVLPPGLSMFAYNLIGVGKAARLLIPVLGAMFVAYQENFLGFKDFVDGALKPAIEAFHDFRDVVRATIAGEISPLAERMGRLGEIAVMVGEWVARLKLYWEDLKGVFIQTSYSTEMVTDGMGNMVEVVTAAEEPVSDLHDLFLGLKGALEISAGLIVNVLVPAIRDTALWVRDTVIAISEMKALWDILIPVIAGVTAALVLNKAALVASVVWTGLKSAAETIAIASMIAYSAAAGKATIATKALAAAQALLVAISPAGWVAIFVGALVAIGVWLYRNRDMLVETWEVYKTFFSLMGEVAQVLADRVRDALSEATNNFIEFGRAVGEVIMTIVGWVMALPGRIAEAVKAWINEHEQVKRAFYILLGVIATTIAAGLLIIWLAVKSVQAAMKLMADAVEAVSFAWSLMTRELAESTKDLRRDTAESAAETSQKWKESTGQISQAWESLKKSASETWGEIREGIAENVQKVVDGIHKVWDAAHTKLAFQWESLKALAASVWAFIRDAILKAWNTTWAVAGVIWTVFQIGLTKAMTALANWISKAWAWIHDVIVEPVATAVNVVIDFFATLGEWYGRFWDEFLRITVEAGRWLVEKWQEAGDAFMAVGEAVWSNLLKIWEKGFTSMGGIIQKGIGAVVGWLKKKLGALAEVPFIRNIIDSLGEGVDGLQEKIRGGVAKFLDGVKGMGAGIKTRFSDMVTGVSQRMSGFFDRIRVQFTGFKNRVMGSVEAVNNALGALGGGGEDPLDGLGEEGEGGAGSKDKAEKAKKKAKDKKAEDVAKTMADIAKRVAEAIQEGLDALARLAGADMPSRAEWEGPLLLLEEFFTESIRSFDRIGIATLTKVGDNADGTVTLALDTVERVTKVADVLRGLLSAYQQGAQAAAVLAAMKKFPSGDQMSSMETFLTDVVKAGKRIADILPSAVPPEGEDGADGKGPSALDIFVRAAQAIEAWASAMRTATETAAVMAAVELGSLDAARAKVAEFVDQVVAIGTTLMSRLSAAIPDEDDQKEALERSEILATVLGGWVKTFGFIGEAMDSLARVRELPRDLNEHVSRFLIGLVGTIHTLALPLLGGEADRLQTDLMAARALADVLSAWAALAAQLGESVLSLRKVPKVPTDVLPKVESVLQAIADLVYDIMPDGFSKMDPDRFLNGLAMAQGVAQTLTQAIGLIHTLALAGEEIGEAAEFPDEALPRLQKTLTLIGQMVYELSGSGKWSDNLKKTQTDLAVANAVLETLQNGISLLYSASGLAEALDETESIDPGKLEQAIQNVVLIRDKIIDYAEQWKQTLEDSGKLFEEVVTDAGNFMAAAGAALEFMGQIFGTWIPEKIERLKPEVASTALDNARAILDQVIGHAETWADLIEEAGKKFEDVYDRVVEFAAIAVPALDLFSKMLGISIPEKVDSIERGSSVLMGTMNNVRAILDQVVAHAETWADNLEDMKKEFEDVYEQVQQFLAVAGPALDLMSDAFGIEYPEKLERIERSILTTAMDNVRTVLDQVVGHAETWADLLEEMGKEFDDVAEATMRFITTAGPAMDLMKTALGLVMPEAGVATISRDEVAGVMNNVRTMLDTVVHYAEQWKLGLERAGKTMAGVQEAVTGLADAARPAIEMLGRAVMLFHMLNTSEVTGDVATPLARVADNIRLMITELARVFDTIEDQEGTLKKAGDLSEIVGPAAEAVAKVLDALSFESLMNNPLVNRRSRGHFKAGGGRSTPEELAAEIQEGLRRMVQLLVDALKDIEVDTEDIAVVDRLAEVWDRIIGIMERIAALDLNTDKVKEIAALARELAGIGFGAGQIGDPAVGTLGGKLGAILDGVLPGGGEGGKTPFGVLPGGGEGGKTPFGVLPGGGEGGKTPFGVLPGGGEGGKTPFGGLFDPMRWADLEYLGGGGGLTPARWADLEYLGGGGGLTPARWADLEYLGGGGGLTPARWADLEYLGRPRNPFEVVPNPAGVGSGMTPESIREPVPGARSAGSTTLYATLNFNVDGGTVARMIQKTQADEARIGTDAPTGA